jgi:hypothetical protein
MGGPQLAAPTAWDLAPTHSTAVGMSIVVRTRIGTAITGTNTPIGTAIVTGPTRRTVALAGGGLQRGACGCAVTGAPPTAIGTAITSTHIGTAIVDTATIVRTAATMVRPTDEVPPTDTDAGKVVAERDKCGPSSSPARGAGEPLSGAGLR